MTKKMIASLIVLTGFLGIGKGECTDKLSLLEMQALNNTPPSSMRSMYNSSPLPNGGDSFDDSINTLTNNNTTGLTNIANALDHGASTSSTVITTRIGTLQGSLLGNQATFDGARTEAGNQRPATGAGAANGFIDGTIGTVTSDYNGGSGTDFATEERALLRLAYRRLKNGITDDGTVPGAEAFGDSRDTPNGLTLATNGLGVLTEDNVTLSDIVKVLYLIRLKN